MVQMDAVVIRGKNVSWLCRPVEWSLNNVSYGRQKRGDKTAVRHWQLRLHSAKGGAFQSLHKKEHILHSVTSAFLTNVKRLTSIQIYSSNIAKAKTFLTAKSTSLLSMLWPWRWSVIVISCMLNGNCATAVTDRCQTLAKPQTSELCTSTHKILNQKH